MNALPDSTIFLARIDEFRAKSDVKPQGVITTAGVRERRWHPKVLQRIREAVFIQGVQVRSLYTYMYSVQGMTWSLEWYPEWCARVLATDQYPFDVVTYLIDIAQAVASANPERYTEWREVIMEWLYALGTLGFQTKMERAQASSFVPTLDPELVGHALDWVRALPQVERSREGDDAENG